VIGLWAGTPDGPFVVWPSKKAHSEGIGLRMIDIGGDEGIRTLDLSVANAYKNFKALNY
jgi:hypothetical protein